jgi:hypothetical protein
MKTPSTTCAERAPPDFILGLSTNDNNNSQQNSGKGFKMSFSAWGLPSPTRPQWRLGGGHNDEQPEEHQQQQHHHERHSFKSIRRHLSPERPASSAAGLICGASYNSLSTLARGNESAVRLLLIVSPDSLRQVG